VRVDTGVYEGGEIPLHYDSLIAKLITHAPTRAEAIARMRAALNEFVIRGISSNIIFQSALIRHPRFASGNLTTAFISEEFPDGFHAADVPPEDPAFLVAVAATVHRAYRNRAATIEGQVRGHEIEVGDDYVVRGAGEDYVAHVRSVPDGCDVRVGKAEYAIRHAWKFGDILVRGTCNGKPFAVQVERQSLNYRIAYMGTQMQLTVLPPRAAELLKRMPYKAPPDTSRFLLSPMPGLLAEIAVATGQEVKIGERLVVIEAMKMQNVILAERNGIIGEILAVEGDSLAVDQPLLTFQ
jgi:propionyl-CoA carboxylase alpha chain